MTVRRGCIKFLVKCFLIQCFISGLHLITCNHIKELDSAVVIISIFNLIFSLGQMEVDSMEECISDWDFLWNGSYNPKWWPHSIMTSKSLCVFWTNYMKCSFSPIPLKSWQCLKLEKVFKDAVPLLSPSPSMLNMCIVRTNKQIGNSRRCFKGEAFHPVFGKSNSKAPGNGTNWVNNVSTGTWNTSMYLDKRSGRFDKID